MRNLDRQKMQTKKRSENEQLFSEEGGCTEPLQGFYCKMFAKIKEKK